MRPTSDKVRGAVFNILAGGDERRFAGARVLDLFAGTGALGIEALSRGAKSAVFLETDGRALDALRDNLRRTGFEGSARALRRDAERDLGDLGRFDLVFVDPPYALVPRSRAIASLPGLLAPGGSAVVEHATDAEPPTPAGLAAVDRRRYGSTGVTFYAREGADR